MTTFTPYDYDHCRICGADVTPDLAAYYRRRVENAMCGNPACARREVIARFGCCAKAEITPCVCAYSFSCPDHSMKHIGTHD